MLTPIRPMTTAEIDELVACCAGETDAGTYDPWLYCPHLESFNGMLDAATD